MARAKRRKGGLRPSRSTPAPQPPQPPTLTKPARSFKPPAPTAKTREDLHKALASLLQNVALTFLGAGIVIPFLTAGSTITGGQVAARGIIALGLELISIAFLVYIPYSEETKKG